MTNEQWPAPGDPAPLPPPMSGAPSSPPPPSQPYGASQPYGGSQPFASGSSPYPAPKKRKIWPWVLGLLGVIVLGIGGCSYLLVGQLTAPVGVANDFLAQAQVANYGSAVSYVSTTDQCFGADAEATLAEFFGPLPFSAYNLTGSEVNSVNGSTTGGASGTITIAGEDHAIDFAMVKLGDDWLICGIDIG